MVDNLMNVIRIQSPIGNKLIREHFGTSTDILPDVALQGFAVAVFNYGSATFPPRCNIPMTTALPEGPPP
jgi:hypothetical protein